jgi:hypothetical protein
VESITVAIGRPVARHLPTPGWGGHLLTAAFFVALAVVYTYPLVTRLPTHFAAKQSAAKDPNGDQLLIAWMLASTARQLAREPLRVFETNNYHPFKHTLAYSENLLGIGALVLPVQWIGDNPTLTHNVAYLLVLVLSGWGTSLLVGELTGNRLAGVLAGVLVVYAPYNWGNLFLMHVLAYHWIPIALFSLARLLRQPRWRWSLALGVTTALQAWSSLHHGMFLAIALVVCTSVLLVTSAAARRALPQLVCAGLLAAGLTAPMAAAYRVVWSEMEIGARAGALGFSLPLARLRLPIGDALDYFTTRLDSGKRIAGVAALTPWLLIAAGLVTSALMRRPRRVDPRFLAALIAAGLTLFYVALGPQPRIAGWWPPSLYAFLAEHVPGVAGLRVPMRAASFSYFVLCVLAGCGAASLLRRLPGWKSRGAVSIVVIALAVVEAGWQPVALVEAPARCTPAVNRLATLPADCAVAEIPVRGRYNQNALFRSTCHWRGLVNGYSGFEPLGRLTRVLTRFPAPPALDFLHAAGACAVIVRRDERLPGHFERVIEESRALGLAVDASADEAFVGLPEAPEESVLGPVLPRSGWRPGRRGDAAARLAFDGDLDTEWRGMIWTLEEPDRLVIDLGAPTTVTALVLRFGPHVRQYMKSYRIAGALDGRTWTTLAEASVATPPLASYRLDHHDVRQRIALRGARVRWLRIGPYRRRPENPLRFDAQWREWIVPELYAYGARREDG